MVSETTPSVYNILRVAGALSGVSFIEVWGEMEARKK
jgi:hypothetical protein